MTWLVVSVADAFSRLPSDSLGKPAKLFLLRGVVQADGTSADVYVQCAAAVDIDGRAVDTDAGLDVQLRIVKELSRIRKALGDFMDNAELLLDTDGGDDDAGDDDGGDS